MMIIRPWANCLLELIINERIGLVSGSCAAMDLLIADASMCEIDK